jgi:excisionase family DNA binding protein
MSNSQTSGNDYSIISDIQQFRKALLVTDLARILNCSKQKVYTLVEKNSLPAIRIGSMIRFDPKTTAQWLRDKSTVN